MKKTLTVLAILFLFGFAPTASAQLSQPSAVSCDPNALVSTCSSTQTCSSSGVCVDGSASLGQITTGASPSASAPVTDPAAAQTATDLHNNTTDAYNGVMIFLMGIFAWLLGVAALTLDYSVYYTVVVMGNFIHNLTAVGVTWRILRDIGNIALIFGFLAIGITTILNVDWYGSAKKMLPMLLIAAVFLNFSLFISEAVIDVGNLFATQFYTQINGGVLPTAASLSQQSFSTNVSQEGISNKIMDQLGLTTIYGDIVTDPVKAKGLFSNGTPAFVGFMGILLFMTAAFVMFSLAFILIARFVALLFLIMLSPIGFAGMAIPQLKSKASLWWSTLFDQTITAPILLLLLYIALTVITDANFLTGFMPTTTAQGIQGSWTGFVQGKNLPGFAGVLLSFLVAMGLLLSVTMFAKKLSAFGSGAAMKLGSKLSGAGLAAAGAGFAGRYSVGLGSKYAAKGLRNTGFGRTFVGRGMADKIEKVSGKSFDVRNTAGAKKLAGYGLDMGAGQKGGYAADFKGRVESYGRAAAGIGDRKETRGEKVALAAAGSATAAAKMAHTTAQKEHEDHKGEIKRLEDERNRIVSMVTSYPGKEDDIAQIDQKLAAARGSLPESENKVLVAERAHEKISKETEELEDKVKKATSGDGRKATYQNRLANKWGKIPLLGTAAAAAAGKNIKEAKESGKLDSLIKKMVDEGVKAGLEKEKVANVATPAQKAPNDEH